MAESAHNHLGMERQNVGHKDLQFRSLLVALRKSTLSFWLVAVLHTLFLSAYHLFSNYSGNFLFEVGWVGGVSVQVCVWGRGRGRGRVLIGLLLPAVVSFLEVVASNGFVYYDKITVLS